MSIPTLVVSNPPHGEVNLDAAAELLQLDVYATRLKSVFSAPEVMEAADVQRASEFASALRSTGFRVAVIPGRALANLPWPAPVTAMALDVSSLQVTMGDETLRIPSDAEVLSVLCSPPDDRLMRPTVEILRALESGHGPTIAHAIQRRTILDLYFRHGESLRRATIVPDLLNQEGDRLLRDLRRRFTNLRVDERLSGLRPRAPYSSDNPRNESTERRRYSFGTLMLSNALKSIAPELYGVTQYELASRLAWAINLMTSAAAD